MSRRHTSHATLCATVLIGGALLQGCPGRTYDDDAGRDVVSERRPDRVAPDTQPDAEEMDAGADAVEQPDVPEDMDAGADTVEGPDVPEGMDAGTDTAEQPDVPGMDRVVPPEAGGEDVMNADVQDVQPDRTTSDADVVSPDTTPTPTCHRGVDDPTYFWYQRDTLAVNMWDGSRFGEASDAVDPDFLVKNLPAAPPDARAGSCSYYRVGLGGSATRNAARSVNYGTTTAVQGSRRVVFTYDNSTGLYTRDTSMARPLIGNELITANIPGVPGVSVGGTASLRFPPIWTPAQVSIPSSYNQSRDFTVTWEVRPEHTDCDRAFWLSVEATPELNHTVVCIAPARAGRMTVPSAINRHQPAGSYFTVMGVARMTDVPGANPPMLYRVAQGVAWTAVVFP